MTPRTLNRAAWLAAAVAGLMLLAVAAHGVGMRWDPLGLERKRLARTEAALDAAQAEAAARREEAEAERRRHERMTEFHGRTAALERQAAVAIEQAEKAHDAKDMLDAGRAERLRFHDERLCRLSPDLDGCAAPADPG